MSLTDHEQRMLDQGRRPEGWPTPPPARLPTAESLALMWDDPNFCPATLDLSVPSHDTVQARSRPGDPFEVRACRWCGQRFIDREERGLESLTEWAEETGQEPREKHNPLPAYAFHHAGDFARVRRAGLDKWSAGLAIARTCDVKAYREWWTEYGGASCSYCQAYRTGGDCGRCPLWQGEVSDVCNPNWDAIHDELHNWERAPRPHVLIRLTARMYAAILLSEDPNA